MVMNPKFTNSCRVEISIGNKHVFSNDVYIFPEILILVSKQSLVHRFYKRNKKTPWFFKGTGISAITLHYMHSYSILQANMFVFISTDNHMLDQNVKLCNKIFFLSKEMCFYIKTDLVKIVCKFLTNQNLHFIY